KWGSFLSGGLDSSFVVWALQQYAKCDTFYATFGRLDSYMAIPDEQSVAAEVAAAFHTEHKVLSIGSEAIQRVKGIVEAIEEPFCDGGPIVIDAVLAAAAARGDAMMTGNGGDFLFGGERRHLLVSLMGNRKMAPVWMLAQIASALAPAKLPSERLARLRFDLQRCLALRNLTVADFYSQRFSGEQEILGLFHKDIDPRGFRSPAACIESELGHVGDLDDLTKVLYLDLKVLTPNLLIRDVRSVARGYGVNTYHPYLDSKFVEFGMGIPSRLKVRGLTLKHIMRKAMEPHLPESVLTKKKGGLGAPILYWVTDRKGLVADVLSEETIRRRGLFSYGAIEKMRNATVSRSKDYSMLLWTIFTTELWMQQFVDQQADSAAPALRRA
ncbi:MAG: asnB 1, partial [Hyphomicrobiales bacterium]|nr:asnB 1 [Hyphomicrobiales bacterium]